MGHAIEALLEKKIIIIINDRKIRFSTIINTRGHSLVVFYSQIPLKKKIFKKPWYEKKNRCEAILYSDNSTKPNDNKSKKKK